MSLTKIRPQLIGRLRFWIGILISAVCLYLSLQGIRLEQVWDALSAVNPLGLLIGLVFFFGSYLSRVFRWQVLFYPQSVRFQNILSILSIGYLLSNILPARLGDLARVYLIGEKEKISKAGALSTIVVERIVDGLFVALLLLALIGLMPQIPQEARATGLIAAGGGVVALLLLAVLSSRTETLRLVLARPLARIRFIPQEKLWGVIESTVNGFAILRAPRPLLFMLGWTALIWAFTTLFYWTLMLALGMSLPLTAPALVIAVTGLAVVVPSSPGYVGVFHLVAQQTLVQGFGTDSSLSLSFAFLAHGLTYLSVTLLGICYLWREGLSLGDLRARRV